jgi:hypothetical protein
MEHKPYHVTSGLMHGPGIKELQNLLRNNNYLEDAADGVYGVHTAQAVYRAKYWLGYPRPDQVASDKLINLLKAVTKPGPAMRVLSAKRRAIRAAQLKKNKQLTKGQRVVKKALTQLGETEHPPNSNKSKFSAWYGLVGAWCAMFVSWCGVGINSSFKKGRYYAYVPYMRNDAVAGRNGLMVTTVLKSGVIACYDWPPKDGVADHTGYVVTEADLHRFAPKALHNAVTRFGPLGPGDFWAIEGNTGVGNDSNGGETMIRKRNRSYVQTFIKAS